MTAPKRVQQHRSKGWRKPEGAISVARPHTSGGHQVVAKQEPRESAKEGRFTRVTRT